MGWWDWLTSNFIWRWFFQIRAKLIFVGLDNAGKTTLLHVLKDDRVATHLPTQRPTKEEMQLGLITLECHDLGGHADARELWHEYYVHVDAIVFLVDANDRTRMAEARRELNAILTNEALKNVPIAVLGNKIDLSHALSEHELRQELNLGQTSGKNGLTTIGMRPIEVFMISVIQRQGYADAFAWLQRHLEC